MKLLFVADPLETFKTYKDTTFAMMREAARRGHTLARLRAEAPDVERGGRVSALVRDIALTGDAERLVRDRARIDAGQRRSRWPTSTRC